MKKIRLAFLLTVILVTLCACGATPETPTDTDDPQTAQTISPAQDSQPPQSTHRTETLCDGLVIDADLPAWENLALSAYQANHFSITAADAISLLAGGRQVAAEEPHHYDPNGFTLVLEDGAEIFHANGTLSYWSETEARDREVADLLSRYRETHSGEDVHALPFLSPEEAADQIGALIGALDLIGEPALDAIIGLSGAEIMAWQQERMTDEDYRWWADIGKTVVLDDLTSEDDAYYCSFYFTCQGVPVFDQDREPGISSASDSFPPCSMKAEALLTPKGVRYFTVQNALSAQGNLSEAQTILSPLEALEKVREKQENTITFGTQRITEVWLEYVPVRTENTVEGVGPYCLRPYWCFGTVDGERPGGPVTNAERINAVTGDDLAYEQ